MTTKCRLAEVFLRRSETIPGWTRGEEARELLRISHQRGKSMKRFAAFPIALALGAIILVPRAGAQAQVAREGPTEIEKCKTISQPGSYKLVNNLTFKGTTGNCLEITANFVTIDLAGFTIS